MPRCLILFLFPLMVASDMSPNFVTDAPVVRATAERPEHFTVPARFAVLRSVYGRTALPSAQEAAIWADVLANASALGSFHMYTGPFLTHLSVDRFGPLRDQRFNYLLTLAIDPGTGSVHIAVFDVASGALMADMAHVTDHRGRGFWGGRISNPNRLARLTTRIARDAGPHVTTLLDGIAARAHP